MKNIEMIRATKSTLPNTAITNASAAVTMVPFLGSFSLPLPAARNSVAPGTATTRSEASACSVRGATRMEPIADDSVAQASPIGMIGPHMAMRLITS